MQDPSAPLTTHTDSTSEFVIYNTEDGRTEVQLRLIDGSVWMTQAEMSELFDVTRASISAHLTNIYSENELTRDRTIKKFLTVRSEGDRNEADHSLVEALQEADRKLISQRKRLQPRRKSD